MNIFFYIIIGSLLFEFGLRTISKYLDLKQISSTLPDSFKNYYDAKKYKKSQEYLKENTQFSYLTSTTKRASGRPFISLIPPTLA